MFLYTLMAEGGMPGALLAQAGQYRRVVLGLLTDIEAEGGAQAAPFADRIATRWIAALPQTFQSGDFARLMAEFALALAGLRAMLPEDLPAQAAERWLDANRPGRMSIGAQKGLCLTLGAACWWASGWDHEASAQQVKFGAAIHLSFDQLEFGDLAFGLAVRPRLGESGGHRGEVSLDPLAERRHQAAGRTH